MIVLETMFAAPLLIWVNIVILCILVLEGVQAWHRPWAKPALVVYGTIGIWYIGDYLAAGPERFERFTEFTLNTALIQVAACLVLLRCMIPKVVGKCCEGLASDSSQLIIKEMWLLKALRMATLLWFVLLVLATLRLLSYPNFLELWPAFFWPPI